MKTISVRQVKDNPFTVTMGDHGPVAGLAYFTMQLDNAEGVTHADLEMPMHEYRCGSAQLVLVVRKHTTTDADVDGATLLPFVTGGNITITDSLNSSYITLIHCKRKSAGIEQAGPAVVLVPVTVMFSDYNINSSAPYQTAANNYAAGWSMGHD